MSNNTHSFKTCLTPHRPGIFNTLMSPLQLRLHFHSFTVFFEVFLSGTPIPTCTACIWQLSESMQPNSLTPPITYFLCVQTQDHTDYVAELRYHQNIEPTWAIAVVISSCIEGSVYKITQDILQFYAFYLTVGLHMGTEKQPCHGWILCCLDIHG